MNVFAESYLSDYLTDTRRTIESEIWQEDKNRLLNVNEIEYIQYLVQKHSVQPIQFLWDRVTVSDREEMIPAEKFPRTFDISRGKSYRKQVITYHVPFSGTFPLLRMRPSQSLPWHITANATPPRAADGFGDLTFDLINWNNDAKEIKREADSQLGNLRQQAQCSSKEVDEFNRDLEKVVTSLVQGRKQQILRESKVLAGLGVPVKRSDSVPSTFAIPIRKTSIEIRAPDTSARPYTPEPTLDQGVYRRILEVCQATGVEMERHPGIYMGKDEETLRDHFIMVLSPHFQSVTGETFNRIGKTDVLIRHEGRNVFVAECKFWKGPKAHYETINQILSYLTWRDSKSAILYFVRNKNLTPVLEEIEQASPSHACFVEYSGQVNPGWFAYHFHLLDDHTRGVELAILCFHLPE